MSYTYQTQWDSPNYTPRSQTRSVWGVDRSIRNISIHWWDDPTKQPSYEGVIALLCSPARQASAHYVATGTGRRVACLVSPYDNAWATNSDNPYTISIECDPRCRPEDYDVVAELIANIRSAYGDLPLVPHNQFVATRCPGDWNLGRLDAWARQKDGSGDWGVVTTFFKPTPPTPPVVVPPEPPKPVEPPVVPEPPVVTPPVEEPPKTVPPSDPLPVEPPKRTSQSIIVDFLSWLIEKLLALISPHVKRIK